MQAFPEQEIGEQGHEDGLQVEQHAGTAGAERLDAAIVEIIHQRVARPGHVGERQQAIRVQGRAAAGSPPAAASSPLTPSAARSPPAPW